MRLKTRTLLTRQEKKTIESGQKRCVNSRRLSLLLDGKMHVCVSHCIRICNRPASSRPCIDSWPTPIEKGGFFQDERGAVSRVPKWGWMVPSKYSFVSCFSPLFYAEPMRVSHEFFFRTIEKLIDVFFYFWKYSF